MHARQIAGQGRAEISPKSQVSIGPLYEDGGCAVSGVIVLGAGPVAPAPFWKLLHRLAAHSAWLRGAFALTSRPRCYGIVSASCGPPLIAFRGVWRTAPHLTLLLGGRDLDESALAAELAGCFAPAAPSAADPFPRWQPGDPWMRVAFEGTT